MSRRAWVAFAASSLIAGILAALTLSAPALASIPWWTTYHRDGQRSGVDPDSSSPLPPTRLWQTSPALDGQIYGQPLVYGPRVYVATENDTVYALDSTTGAVIWHKGVGLPVPDASTAGCGNIGNVGITSTPVIDPATNRIYAVADTWDGSHTSTIKHILVGFNLSDGSPAPGLPITVDAPGSKPRYQLQRTGLALDAGRIVIGYGGNSGDCGDYHGWLVSAPESGSGGLRSFEIDASGRQGAIWGAGNAPAIDSSGNIWVATGNGSSPAYDYQESVLKLSITLTLLGHWVPSNWQSLDASDTDIGSSEPLPLPGGMLFQIGKEGVGYLLSSAPAELYHANVCPGEAFGGGVYYSGIIYVACADGLQALSLNSAAHTFSQLGSWNVSSNPIGPPIVAAGLVWSADWGSSTLYALDRTSGATRFSQDPGTNFNHFASPSAAGGRLFVANGDRVTAFTIAKIAGNPPPPPPVAPTISGAAISVASRKLTLALSQPASVKVVISRVLNGRRVHRRCRTHAKKGRRCQYSVRKRTQTFPARQGVNVFTLPLGGLAKGHYTATITATSSRGLRSKRLVLRFRVGRR